METPRIFVIIPVYNVKDYLSACIGSLQAQTFTDWQAVLVDDGSTDGSGALCDVLASQEPRLQVIHQPNGGISAARNAGMRVMQGEAVAFLDSDDILPPEFLQELWAAFDGNDLALCDAEEHDVHGGITRISAQWPQHSASAADYLRAFVYADLPPLLVLSCCNKLYRIDLLRKTGIQQPIGCHRGEDGIFNVLFMNAVNRVSYTSRTAYHYMRREGSLMDKHPELIAPAQAQQLRLLTEAAQNHGLLSDADFRTHLSQYRLQAFFFTVYAITNARLGRKRAVPLLNDLLQQRIVSSADITTARGRALPWLLLRLVTALKSGLGMLVWLVLAGKLHWN